MPRPVPIENDILRKVDSALESAVRTEGLDWWEPNRIKRVKYAYLAVQEYTEPDEHPITFSWFKFGPGLIASSPQQDSLDGGGYEVESPQLRTADIYNVNPNELVSFFRGIDSVPIQEYWESENLDFLEAFYKEHGHEEYGEIYVGNVHLRKEFEDWLSKISARATKEPVQKYERIGTIVAKLHIELSNEVLEPVLDDFIMYTDILQDAYMMLEKKPPNALTENDLEAVQSLKRFYSDVAWPAIAGRIGHETAVGPKSDDLAEWGITESEKSLEVFTEELEEVKGKCAEANLLANHQDYPQYTDELDESINNAISNIDE